MAETEERIASGVIGSALKAAKASTKAAYAAEQQINAYASFVNDTPTAEELSKVPEHMYTIDQFRFVLTTVL